MPGAEKRLKVLHCSFRLTESEHAALIALADEDDRKINNFVRRLVVKRLQKRTFDNVTKKPRCA